MRCFAWFLFAVFVHTAPAAAEAHIDLVWEAPAACPDARALNHSIARYTREALADGSPQDLRVRGRVREVEGAYELTLAFSSGNAVGQETLTAARCSTLVDVVVLKVALALDARLSAQLVAREAERPAYGFVRAAASASSGVVPAFAPGLALTAGVRFAHVGLELGGLYEMPRDSEYAGLARVGGTFQAALASARVCALPSLGRVLLPLCSGFEAGMIRARGFGGERSSVAHEIWAAVPVTVGLRYPQRGAWGLWAEASALVALLRPSFQQRNLDTLYKPNPIGARALLGVELDFL